MKPRLRILLLQPTWDGLGYRRKIKINERAIHPLALGVVAALSGDHAVTLVNEAQQAAPTDGRVFDLVGISVNTFNAPRAFQFADTFRAQGVSVVLGGPHTALAPEACLRHADAIVLGDAEPTWPQVLEDAASGRLQARYFAAAGTNGPVSMPAPRRELFARSSPLAAYCQITRGCTNTCRFCYLQYMPETRMRWREISDVMKELETLPQPVILFVDDNLFCQIEYTKAVLRALTGLGKRWWIQAPTTLHHDAELIPLMARSGCYSVSIGFQTVRNANNQDERILQNHVEEYGALVEVLHGHGILVDGTFIFGFDGDDETVFDATEELIRRLRLDSYTFYFLTPYPGTPYFDHFQREGRILSRDWSKFDWDHVVVHPKHMTPEALQRGVRRLYQTLDRSYFLRNAATNYSCLRRNCSSPRLLSFLADTGWSYYRSPIFPV